MTARLYAALDTPALPAALALARRLAGGVDGLKLGLEFFVGEGPEGVRKVSEAGAAIFLDLKLHDIPNTVAGAVRSATTAGAELLTVHGFGGGAMLRAAAEAAQAPGSPRLLAVTVLTSMDPTELASVGVSCSPADQALRLARLARDSGIDGMVCSADEVSSMRHQMGPDAILVIPGIRPVGATVDDQRRVATPGEAILRGASMLVVGRPITRASDPAAAARLILDEIAATQKLPL